MIKSFSGQVVFCFAVPEPCLLMLAKTDYPSIVRPLNIHTSLSRTCPMVYFLIENS